MNKFAFLLLFMIGVSSVFASDDTRKRLMLYFLEGMSSAVQKRLVLTV